MTSDPWRTTEDPPTVTGSAAVAGSTPAPSSTPTAPPPVGHGLTAADVLPLILPENG